MEPLRSLHPPDLARRALLLAMLGSIAGCGRPRSPAFGYTLLDGSTHTSAALRSKVVLVNFWATGCGPCVADMPRFVDIHRRFHGRGVEVLAVAMQYDAPAAVSNFAWGRQLPFGVVIDNTGAIAAAFGDVQVTPTTFVIDKRGAIAWRGLGEPDFGELQRLLDRLLAES